MLQIIDFKYGKGVPVDAHDNPQLRLYALGAINEFELLEDFELVEMTIVQPRLDSISTDTMTVDELMKWAEEEVVPAGKMAYAGEGEFNPSTETCRFCKGRNLCRYYAAYNLKVGNLSDLDGPAMTALEIGGLLEDLDGLVRWAKGLKEWANEQALAGMTFPGWKVVTGRSNRRITDKGKALDILINNGYAVEDIATLNGITDLSKKVKDINELLGDLIEKPEGAPTLVK